jgi:quercetin dioxygenase-like cupin family protein
MNQSDIVTLHLHSQDVPWVAFTGGTDVRVLHARPDDDFIVTQIMAPPGAESELHRHLGPVFGWTNSGRWGHDKNYEYRPGTYIFETPNVIHRFHGGDEPTDAVFVSYGMLERLDPDTLEVYKRLGPTEILAGYFQACEEQGLPRPNVLA